MSWVRRILPLPVVVLLVTLVAVQVGMLVLSRARSDGPTGLSVGVSGPVLVAQALVERAGALPDGPVEATVVDRADGRQAVSDGRLDGLLVIDLADDADRLMVSAVADPDVVAGLEAHIARASALYGRTVTTTEVAPPDNVVTDRRLPVALVVAWVLAGLTVAIVATVRGGPVPRTSRAGRRRTGIVALASLAGGALSAVAVLPWVDGILVQTFVVGSLSIFAGAVMTLALEGLFGLAGIGVAATVVVGTLTPMLTLTEPELLSPHVARALALTPPWAAREVLLEATYVGRWAPMSALAILAMWCAIPLLTLVVERRERPAAPEPV